MCQTAHCDMSSRLLAPEPRSETGQGTTHCPEEADASKASISLRQTGTLRQRRNVRCDFSAHEIVDDHRTIEPSDDGLCAVQLLDARLPFAAIDRLGGLPRLPEINAAGRAAVLRPYIIFADQARQVLIF